MATTGTKTPAIPTIPKVNADLDQFLGAIKEALEVRLGRRGDPKDRAVTLRELIDSGLAKELLDNPFDPNAGLGVTDFAPIIFTSSTIPPTPTGFSASGAFTKIIVSWDNPQYNGLAYTEIWRHTSDDVPSATRIDTTRSFVWADTVDPGETYFYWVRHVSTSDVIGAFSLSDSATTAKVDASIIQDAVITGQKLVDEAVTAAKIAGGTITASQIAAETIAAGNMAAGSITAGNAALADLSVVRAKIVDGEIVNAKIGLLAVDNARIANGTIAHGKIASLDAAVINTNSLNIAGAAIDGFMGAVLSDQGSKTFTNTGYGSSGASYHSPEAVCTPITLTIPPTATGVAKSFLIRLSLIPAGVIAVYAPVGGSLYTYLMAGWSMMGVQIGFATSSGLAYNASPFYSSGTLQAAYASVFDYRIQAVPITIGHKFSVTTDTSSSTTVYIYGWAGLTGVINPGVQYILSVEGLYR